MFASPLDLNLALPPPLPPLPPPLLPIPIGTVGVVAAEVEEEQRRRSDVDILVVGADGLKF